MERTGALRRAYEGPAFFAAGFRPFFLCGALFAGVAVPLWILFLNGFAAGTLDLDPLYWHAHEMMFGYLGAIMGGFLLTAIPNWTGRLPVMGPRLGGLLALWIAGRIAVLLFAAGSIPASLALGVDLAYPLALVATASREIAAGQNWRNLPVAGLIAIFGIANLVFYLSFWTEIDALLGIRLAIGVAALLISLIGGRVTPSFTRNWLAKEAGAPFPAPFGAADKAALVLTGLSVLAWVSFPDAQLTALLLALAGIAQIVRLSRWQGFRTKREPLVLILHIGYGWLAFALLAMGVAILAPQVIEPRAALHALTAGAIGTMTVAIMTRATLGHTGRALVTDRGTRAIYLLVSLGALLRVAAPSLPFDYTQAVSIAGALWSAGFIVFSVKYGRYLTSSRR